MHDMVIIKFAGLAGMIAALLGLSAVFVSIFLCGAGCGEGTQVWNRWGSGGGFSWSSNALSDLGVSRVAGIFNYSLVVVGILNFMFAVGFMKAHAKSILFRLGGILLVLGGGSLSLVGVFTEEYGALHSYVSLGYFVIFPMAIIVTGVAFVRMNMLSRGYPSILVGIVSLAVILPGIAPEWHRWLGLGFAVPETMEAIAIAAWVLWTGASLARPRR